MSLDWDRVAAALPAYEVGEELGRGSFGIVWAGEHRRVGRRVAIKQMAAPNAEDRARFLAEAKVLASLEHPHIVPLYDYVEAGDQCLLVMERLEGGTLTERFALPRPVDIASACAVAMVTCAALHHAHRRGVLHRDVKPDNLIFTHDGHLKVTDFGIAKVVTAGAATRSTAFGAFKGTPAYMAPEQVLGDPPGPGVDIYATGLLLYELLCAELPFSDEGQAVAVALRRIHEQPRSLEETAPELRGPLSDVTMKALNRLPADRFPTAEDFGVAIGRAATSMLGPGWLDRSQVTLLAAGPIFDSAHVAAGPRAPDARPTMVVPDNGPTETILATPAPFAPPAPAPEATKPAVTPPSPPPAPAPPARAPGGWHPSPPPPYPPQTVPAAQRSPAPPTPAATQPSAPPDYPPPAPPAATQPLPPPAPAPAYLPPSRYPPGPATAPLPPPAYPPSPAYAQTAATSQFPTAHLAPPAPPAKKRGLPGAALAAIIGAVVIVLGGAAAVVITSHGGGGGAQLQPIATAPPTTAPTTAPTAATTPPTTSGVAAEQAAATQLAGLLQQSTGARNLVVMATQMVGGCQENPRDGIAQIQTGIDERNAIIHNLGAIPIASLPNGTQLIANLNQGLQASIEADRHYIDWMTDMSNAGTCPIQNDSAQQLGDAASAKATAAKRAFVNQWNPIATQFNLPQYAEKDI